MAPGPPARRAVLLGGVGALALGAAAVAAGEASRPAGRPGRGGGVDVAPPAGPGGPVTYRTFASTARGGPVTWGLSTPPGVDQRGLPVVLALHGRGRDAHAAFDLLALDRFAAAHARGGGAPLAVVSVDGGSDTYWHPRAGGDDPLAMIGGELVPRLAALGLRTASLAVTGWSMGGYGALLMARESEAGRLGGVRVAVACAASPALFASYAASARGAFDSAADWARWGDLVAEPAVTRTPLHVACGTGDPFADVTRRYRAAVRPAPRGGLSPGGHDGGYWRSLVTDQLRFVAEHLA